MPTNSEQGALQEKWGPTTYKVGWVGLPTILLDRQEELGLTCVDIVVLAHLIRFWWIKKRWPYPSLEKIAKSMGHTVQDVQLSIGQMIQRGLIAEISQSRNLPTAYNLSGLVATLERAAKRRLEGEEIE